LSRTNSIKDVIFASKGNQSIYTAGQALYADPPNAQILVAPGQWVFVNTDTGLSVGNTATKTTTPNIAIGLAIDLDGDGISDDIRWAYRSISGCSLVSHSAQVANCGVPGISDIYFSDCIECGQTYTIELHVYNPDTEAFGRGWQGSDIYSFSYTPPCGDCTTGDCPDVTVTPEQLRCGLYNVIKGINVDPNWSSRLNNFPLAPNFNYPFDVVQLYDESDGLTFKEFCLTESDGTCIDCVNLPDVGGFSSSAGELDVTFSPTTWVTENATKVSKSAHLKRVASEITRLLDGNGQAVYVPATGNCCTNHKLYVSSCLTDFVLLDGDDSAISSCQNVNPFTDVTIYNECQDCDATNTTNSYTAGLRFFAQAFRGECDCIPGNLAIPEYYSEIEAYAKGGFPQGAAYTKIVQHATIAEGQGFQWQSREFESLRRHSHEDFVYEVYAGKHGQPVANDRYNHVTTNCNDSYCVIHHKVASEAKHSIAGERWFPPIQVTFLIPTADTTTRDSFLETYNAYFSGGACGQASISCA
jgi:hypothetical protein